MKALVTSCGEKTTAVCIEQLKKLGFEVIHDDRRIPWHKKYGDFIAGWDGDSFGDVLRVDADVIVNEKVKIATMFPDNDILMAQFQVFDFYQNDILTGQPVWYSKKVFPIIRSHLHQLDPKRPETWAWRLADVNQHTMSLNGVVGMHGFFQDKETMERARANKKMRGQMGRYGFDLVEQLLKLNDTTTVFG